ncbi:MULTISPECIES: CRISPR-associated RAMP protein Csx10 [unclassified Nostoc]|uniref:type III-D CRISPR-associated RAMP protein Csx10 n=1 Tax=unclassified Nostoc TaxID=2593658 RepID=UPI002AD2F186|nr:CRISPR-associated RAMP protein Csx10 [Nostoc sp. DedQUE03]MDZ7973413.1 CRISPR-associated RAMP protein Csx10 [Nostoc sp. DedQUE03]MDZ8045312.1 CRISPR-associated RAMP protein Csx10 [Nostoc sp. DedQUE02]
MKRIELTITALSPLAIGRQKPGGSINEVEQYIPGSVLRGAIAKHILHRAGMELENLAANGGDFADLFLEENPAIFQNAYPAVGKVGSKHQIVNNTIKVLPATAVSSKANPGFLSKGHGVFDTLIDFFCAEQFNHHYDPSSLNALDDRVDSRVETYNSLYSKHNGKHCTHAATSRLLTRVGINRYRATSSDDILYSIEVLNEAFIATNEGKNKQWVNYVYRGYVNVPNDSLAKKLTDFINDNSKVFRLGGSVSRGLGKVEITAKEIPFANDISSRIHRFNQALYKRWQDWYDAFGDRTPNSISDRTFFTLNLHSDAILTEDWQRTTVISPKMLKQFAAVKDSTNLELHTAYSSYSYSSGWNSAWGLMKDVELVTNKGSVYLFSTSTQNRQIWENALSKLELWGVGERTSEGFGQVEVCNEFHQIFRECAV